MIYGLPLLTFFLCLCFRIFLSFKTNIFLFIFSSLFQCSARQHSITSDSVLRAPMNMFWHGQDYKASKIIKGGGSITITFQILYFYVQSFFKSRCSEIKGKIEIYSTDKVLIPYACPRKKKKGRQNSPGFIYVL